MRLGFSFRMSSRLWHGVVSWVVTDVSE